MADLVVSASDRSLGLHFDEFCRLIPEKCWTRRASNARAEARGNPFLRHLIASENEIAIVLDRASQARKDGAIVPFDVESASGYSAAVLVTQVCRLASRLNESGKHRLRRRIEGAIANSPIDLLALRHELAVATHFVKRRWSVALPELEDDGPGDVRVITSSGQSIVIECKYMSEDKGRKVSRRTALQLHQLIFKSTERILGTLRHGIVLQVRPKDRFPTEYAKLKRIADCVPAAVLGMRCAEVDGVQIIIKPIDGQLFTRVGGLPSRHELDELAFRATGLRNRELMARKSKGGGMLLVQLASMSDDALPAALSETLADAATRQLRGIGDALLCVKVAGMSGLELTRLAQDADPPAHEANTLQLVANQFFDNSNHQHIAGVTYMADDAVTFVNGVTHQGGTAYSFWRPGLPLTTELRHCFA